MKFTGNVTFKLITFIFILSGTLSYSILPKEKLLYLEEHNLKPILKSIPDIDIVDSLTKQTVNLKKNLLK